MKILNVSKKKRETENVLHVQAAPATPTKRDAEKRKKTCVEKMYIRTDMFAAKRKF